jgi:hypothetical protein
MKDNPLLNRPPNPKLDVIITKSEPISLLEFLVAPMRTLCAVKERTKMNYDPFSPDNLKPAHRSILEEDYQSMKAIIMELATENLTYGSEVDGSSCCHFCDGFAEYGNPETAVDNFRHEPACTILKIRELARKLNT